MMESDEISSGLFREESGKLLASVINLLGAPHLEVAEDIVQDTIMAAVNQWRFHLPGNPKAWLYRVAKNKTIDVIRQKKRFVELSPLLTSEWTITSEVERSFSDNEMSDNQLRMMFASCHPAIAEQSQVSLILKTLCGFSVREIARGFLTSEETITKRLHRARAVFRELGKDAICVPPATELTHRLEAVLKCIYLIFTESYFSLGNENIIRKDLCNDAITLCTHLAVHPSTGRPETFALMALMCFHASRFDARENEQGEMLTFGEQDRKYWDRELIATGSSYLGRSLHGDHLSAYHLEAMIAAQYSLSPSYESIDWVSTLGLYDQLVLINGSPAVKINRAYVLSKVKGAAVAIEFLHSLEGLEGNLFYHLMLGEFYKDTGQAAAGREHLQRAAQLATANKLRTTIANKLKQIT